MSHLAPGGHRPEAGRQRLARQALKIGLGVKCLEMARAAMHEQVDHAPRPGGKMRSVRRKRSCRRARASPLLVEQEPMESQRTQASPGTLEKSPARRKSRAIARRAPPAYASSSPSHSEWRVFYSGGPMRVALRRPRIRRQPFPTRR